MATENFFFKFLFLTQNASFLISVQFWEKCHYLKIGVCCREHMFTSFLAMYFYKNFWPNVHHVLCNLIHMYIGNIYTCKKMHCKLHKKANALSKAYYQYIKSTMLFAVEKIHWTPPSNSKFTLQKFRVHALRNCLAKRFKICHTFGMRKSK